MVNALRREGLRREGLRRRGMRRGGRPSVPAVALVVAGLVAAACGSDRAGEADPGATPETSTYGDPPSVTVDDPVDPQTWADTVCEELAGFQYGLAARFRQYGGFLSPEGSDPAEILRTWERLYDGAVDLVDEALDAVNRAGIPEVDGGEPLATELRAALGTLRAEVVDAAGDAAAVRGDRPEVVAEELSVRFNAVGVAIGDELEGVLAAAAEVDPELGAALGDFERCAGPVDPSALEPIPADDDLDAPGAEPEPAT